MKREQQWDQESLGTPSKCPETKRHRNETEVDGPDGATAWTVAFSAFIINFIMAGLSRMSGLLYVAFIDMFSTDRKGASMPFAVRSSTNNLLGPLVGILGQQYGVRYVSIVGGVIGTLSSAACFFANDITWITIIWGGMNGVGTALVTTLTTVVVSQYFIKYRTTASGIAFSGACIGSFIFPPLMEYLLHVYGLEGSFLIIAGIIMHTIPAAMILRKPIWIKIANHRLSKDIESSKINEKTIISKPKLVATATNGVDVDYLRANGELVVKLLTTDISNKESKSDQPCPPKDQLLKEMEDVYAFVGKTPISLRLSEVPPKVRLKFECETSPLSSRSRSLRSARESSLIKLPSLINEYSESPNIPQCKPFILSKLNELHNKNETQIVSQFDEQTLYTKVLKELRKLHKVYEVLKKRNIFASFRPELKIQNVAQSVTGPKSAEALPSNGLWEISKKLLTLHSNPSFLLISLCRAVHFSTFVPTITIIVDYAMDKGFVELDGMYVLVALSIGDLLGRVGLGWITDRGFISLPRYMMVGMIIQGLFTAILPMMNTPITFLPTVTMYAMLQGSVFVRHTVLLSKYLKNSEQSIASGCVNFLAGLLGFAVPSYLGYFRDTMGSYDGIFYVNGIVGSVTGLIWIFESYFVKLSAASAKETCLLDEPKI